MFERGLETGNNIHSVTVGVTLSVSFSRCFLDMFFGGFVCKCVCQTSAFCNTGIEPEVVDSTIVAIRKKNLN